VTTPSLCSVDCQLRSCSLVMEPVTASVRLAVKSQWVRV
jgi:hypothetical protein